MSKLHHENIHRGSEAMKMIANQRLHICGAGAIGSNLAMNLVRSGFKNLVIIDKDRVEEKNLSTQAYGLDDVGGKKADLLRNLIFRDLAESVDARAEELTHNNVSKLLKGASLVLDAFDNASSRKIVYEFCKENKIDCLHAGVNGDFAEVRWNESYIVPQENGQDICDYPLARNLILLTVSVCSETLVNFVLKSKKDNFSITLGDMSINHETD